jgi:hypothetical protein
MVLRFVGMTLVWWSNWTHGSKHDARITSYIQYISKEIAFRISLLSTYEIPWCYRSIMPIPAKVSLFRQRQYSQCKLNQIRPFLVCFALFHTQSNWNPWIVTREIVRKLNDHRIVFSIFLWLNCASDVQVQYQIRTHIFIIYVDFILLFRASGAENFQFLVINCHVAHKPLCGNKPTGRAKWEEEFIDY